MRLLEIVRAEKTGNDVMATAMGLAKRIGKVGVQAGVCDGFVGNRMLAAYAEEVQAMLLEGATPTDVDGALEAWGMAMGPLAVHDLAGLDVSYRIRKERKLTGERAQLARVPDKIVEMGRHGQKTGAGFYKYDANRKRQPDPEIEALIRAEAEAQHIKQRPISGRGDRRAQSAAARQRGCQDPGRGHRAQGQRHRYDVPQRIWFSGLARRPDVAGRPYSGSAKVAERIKAYQAQYGDRWKIAPLIEKAGGRWRQLRRTG